jgi:molybdenum cofactor cytidylyltransferase
MAYGKIAVALLAAGRAERFGGDKLSADLGGVLLGLKPAKMLTAMGFGFLFAICNDSKGELANGFSDLGFTLVNNDQSEAGQSRSLHLAVAAAQKTSASTLLVCLADMPFVSAGHIAAIIEEAGHHASIIASTNGRNTSPPAIFPRNTWPDLLKTNGDSGARAFVSQARLVSASPETLIDIDTRADLAAIAARL